MIESRSNREIRTCCICTHYSDEYGCQLDGMYDLFRKRTNNLDGNYDHPCIHNFTHDEIIELGESIV